MDGFNSITLNSVPIIQHFTTSLRSFNSLIHAIFTPPPERYYNSRDYGAKTPFAVLTPLAFGRSAKRFVHILQTHEVYVTVLCLKISFLIRFKIVRQILVVARSPLHFLSIVAVSSLQRHDGFNSTNALFSYFEFGTKYLVCFR